MDTKYAMTYILALVLVMGFANSDIGKDREECANQLVGLATCLPYVGGDAKAPTPDCCSGLGVVVKNSKKCLCILVKDRDDPSLGLKINATLALELPTLCHAPTNVSECPALLNLPPNSPEAKVFEDFANSTKVSNSTTPTGPGNNSTSNGSSARVQSEGGRGKRWLIIDMVCVVMTCMVLHILVREPLI
ncbi:non-specific lipid transfer protein GPI-anchored 6-like [Rhododendron vialii]|uniref:non-specific lipid transfer protein GPI-anchored 6-like n=1 Tax=Rhododendron vialii TaxID=182163 RepID=UPI00266004DA|nr:non-specific lipid transfer protein GPI-anchored 6-like [Rhododendron vialii]